MSKQLVKIRFGQWVIGIDTYPFYWKPCGSWKANRPSVGGWLDWLGLYFYCVKVRL